MSFNNLKYKSFYLINARGRAFEFISIKIIRPKRRRLSLADYWIFYPNKNNNLSFENEQDLFNTSFYLIYFKKYR